MMPTWRVQFSSFSALASLSSLLVLDTLYIASSDYVFAQSGKSNFNYIYGVGLFGSASLYTLLNLMSEQGIDAYRVASVLGYCLLPMVGVGTVSVLVALESVQFIPFISSCLFLK